MKHGAHAQRALDRMQSDYAQREQARDDIPKTYPNLPLIPTPTLPLDFPDFPDLDPDPDPKPNPNQARDEKRTISARDADSTIVVEPPAL